MRSAKSLPDNHPIKKIFRTYTERGLAQASVRDQDLLLYLANLLVEFMWIENLYGKTIDGKRLESLIDILVRANEAGDQARGDYYRHLGDYSLFMLGMFPEYIARSRRALSPSWYQDTGRIGYQIAGELEKNLWRTQVFRKLADKFDRCVVTLNWVREYSTDPFYQLMFREFGIS
ncbi:MAG: hypothetical protein GXX84_20430 [Acidobacteria bacterium]|nr:hypothetical protein [Acidobacteriota bacterium]